MLTRGRPSKSYTHRQANTQIHCRDSGGRGIHANRCKVQIHTLNMQFTQLRWRQCFKIHLVLRFFRILAVCSRTTTNRCNKHGLSWYYCVCNHTPAANPLPLSCFFFYTEFKATLPSTQLPRGKMENQFLFRDETSFIEKMCLNHTLL